MRAPNGTTVVDIDTQDEAEVQSAQEKFGASPVIVRTGGDKFHIYYRHNGERRRIRPFFGHEIDLLGEGGYCVAPPSIRPGGGAYRFIKGGISDLATLPTIRQGALDELIPRRGLSPRPPPPTSPATNLAPVGAILDGERGTQLFRFAVALRRCSDVRRCAACLQAIQRRAVLPPQQEAKYIAPRKAYGGTRRKAASCCWASR